MAVTWGAKNKLKSRSLPVPLRSRRCGTFEASSKHQQNKGVKKMKTKQYAALTIVAVAAGAFVAFNSPAQSAAGKSQVFKLEGAWIAKVVGMPMQWAYTVSPDPSGRRAALAGSIHVPIPPQAINPALFADWEYNTDMVGELVMTGPDTVEFTAVWYGMKKGFPFDQIVLIGVNSGQGRFTEPGKMTGTHNLGMYAPGTDGDGDGLPDPGQDPAVCLPATSIDTRVPFLQPCGP
jgi:hypothetical protein